MVRVVPTAHSYVSDLLALALYLPSATVALVLVLYIKNWLYLFFFTC